MNSKAGNAAALDKLLDEAGVTLTEEQLDYIAGGFGFFAEPDELTCHTNGALSDCQLDF